MARLFVFDEWLIHDLGNQETPEAQRRAALLLKRIRDRQDKIAVVWGSAWAQKLAWLARSNALQDVSKLAWTLVLDTTFCVIVQPHELKSLPRDLMDIVDPKDRYLVQAYLTLRADLFVTTDQKLARALGDRKDIRVALRDDFLRSYLLEER